jgi:glycosyltransferase involved in cell wall biosynthesis
MKVTVCIPSYNGVKYLGATLQSLAEQTLADFECLLLDDGSSDGTPELAESFGDPRVRVLRNQERLGACANRNRCLGLARGEYLYFLDQDDLMRPENLEHKARLLDSDPAIGFVHSSIDILAEEQAGNVPPGFSAAEDRVVEGNGYFRQLLLQGNHICASAVLVRRPVLEEVGGFDPDLLYAGDYALWLRLCVNRRVGILRQPLVCYRWHGQNGSNRFSMEQRLKEVKEAGRRALAYFRRTTGRLDEAEVLEAALEAVAQANGVIAEFDRGRIWLEEQWRYWQQMCGDWQRIAAGKEENLEQLRGCLAALEQEKALLAGEVSRLAETVRAYQRSPWRRVARRLRALVNPPPKAA